MINQIVAICLMFMTLIMTIFLFSSCTITFTNISTDGANSAVDDEMTSEQDISPDLTIPLM